MNAGWGVSGTKVMYRNNYIDSLRTELLDTVAEHLTPVAVRYGYSRTPLEANIRWRPQVLLLGNYSSGKSTLINEFLGVPVQATGQAPTDDSFTVITYDDSAGGDGAIRVTETRDGKFLLNDPEFPFEVLKKHGERFCAHFRLKKVNSPFLKNLAIIDTPGMLDSITERDRGYNYQEVVGDLAQGADLVLVVFDAHKAGTVREAYISIRDTLPGRTFEDRVLFVLNRIDECSSLIDLLRVYGTLCWNLSQITGRKDIPVIHLTYSQHAATGGTDRGKGNDRGYLHYLENQREDLKRAVLNTPRYHLDHLATFVEMHSERLSHLLEALVGYRKGLRRLRLRHGRMGFLLGLLSGCAAAAAVFAKTHATDIEFPVAAGGVVAATVFAVWMTVVLRRFVSGYQASSLAGVDSLTTLDNQTRRDTWQAIRGHVLAYLKKTRGAFPLREVERQHAAVCRVRDTACREIREALNELAAISRHEPEVRDESLLCEALAGQKKMG